MESEELATGYYRTGDGSEEVTRTTERRDAIQDQRESSVLDAGEPESEGCKCVATIKDEPTIQGGYANWCSVAAYFDGDGSVCGSPKKDVVRIKLEFSDNWRPQVEQIAAFLRFQGIKPAKICLSVGNAYLLYLSSNASILATCKGMLSQTECLYKKRKELAAVVDYLEDRITGQNSSSV